MEHLQEQGVLGVGQGVMTFSRWSSGHGTSAGTRCPGGRTGCHDLVVRRPPRGRETRGANFAESSPTSDFRTSSLVAVRPGDWRDRPRSRAV